MQPDPGRVTFLLVGLLAGLVGGAALAYRFRAEADDASVRLSQTARELDALRAERDLLTTKARAAEQRAQTAELALRRLEDLPAPTATPAEREAREAQEKAADDERRRQKEELLRLLTAGDPAAPAAR